MKTATRAAFPARVLAAFVAGIAFAASPAQATPPTAVVLVGSGQALPYQGETRQLGELGGHAIASDGTVYFSGTVIGGGAGIWRIEAGGFVEILAEGAPIADDPDETWAGYFPSLAANANGDLALYGVNNNGKSVVGVLENGVGRSLAADGEAAPGGEPGLSFSAFDRVWISDDGTVAFSGNARDPASELGGRPGVWIDRSAGLEPVILGEIDGDTIPFDLGEGAYFAYVKIEQDGVSGLFTQEGRGDKTIRLELGSKLDLGEDSYFVDQIFALASKSPQSLALAPVLVDDEDEFVAVPTYLGRAEGEGGLKELSVLFSEPGFLALPVSANAQGSVLLRSETIEGDPGDLILRRSNGMSTTILSHGAGIPGIGDGETSVGIRGTHSAMLAGDDSLIVEVVYGENEFALVLFHFRPPVAVAPRRRPTVAIAGRRQIVTRRSHVVLRGAVRADSRPRVEVRSPANPRRLAVVNRPGTRWILRRLALRNGRNVVRVQAVDAQRLRSPVARVVIRRRS